MFTRIWRTDFNEAKREELEAFAADVSAPMFRQLPGCLGYIYAVAGETWITQTFWESEDDIAAAETSEVYREVVHNILAAGFLGGTQATETFEIATYAAPVG